MKMLFIPFLFLNFLIAEEKVHLSIDKITKNYSVNNNLSGLIELKNHNDTSSGRFALSKDYPVVLNTYKAPVASIIKQVRFYVYEKTGVGVLKMFYLNSDTIAIDSVSMNKKTSFQTELDPDEHSGFCVIWCILFIHYRLLNQDVLLSRLIKHMVKTLTTNKLLKYARHVEDTIKQKI